MIFRRRVFLEGIGLGIGVYGKVFPEPQQFEVLGLGLLIGALNIWLLKSWNQGAVQLPKTDIAPPKVP